MKTISLGALLLSCAPFTPVLGGLITFQSSPLTPVDTVSWSQLGSDLTPLGQTFSASSAAGVVVSGIFAGSGGLTSVVCGQTLTNCSWAAQNSGYTTGDTLLWTEDSNYAGSGPITLSFAAQYGIGAFVQPTAPGNFTAELDLYNGATLLATSIYSSDADSNPLFLGALDDTQEITRAVIAINTCGSDTCDPAGMSMDTLQFYSTTASSNPTPEPASISLLAVGGIGIWALRRHRGKAAPRCKEPHAV